jgi:pSer/pThr/pTyr-binding forkhead associated (FHA) protein
MTAGLYLLRHTTSGVLKSKTQLSEGRLLVGRAAEADLYLPDRSVSREHAELVIKKSRVTVRDLSSRNGTYVNDVRVEESAVLLRQRLRFGSVAFVLWDDSPWVMDGQMLEETADTRSAAWDDSLTPVLATLTAAQRRVFDLLIAGKLEKRIARELDLSQHTVHNHIRAIYRAFGVHTRAELLVRVLPQNE